MINLNKIIDENPFSLKKEKKKKLFLNYQKKISLHHSKKCSAYKKIIDNKNIKKILSLNDLPYLSVNLFKQTNLSSIRDDQKFKTLTSSGTSGQKSQIVLDKNTAFLQQEALLKITNNFLGNERLPMIIVDNENTIKNKKSFSARGAAINGFSIFGKEKCFILDDKLEIDENKLNKFLKKYPKERYLIFGFTFQIWKYFLNNKKIKINNNCIFLHGGGWKKMQDFSDDNSLFINELK